MVRRKTGPRARSLLLRHQARAGCSTTSPARAQTAPSAASSPSARSTPGWSGTSPAARVHVTDVTNASRTLLFNIRTGELGRRAAAGSSRPARDPARGRASSEVVRATPMSGVLGAAVPIAGIAGDQQAALFGQLCTRPGLAKNTYGTGCFLLHEHRRRGPSRAAHRLLTTVAWRIGDAADRVRARGQRLRRRRRRAVAARRARDHQVGSADVERARRDPSPTPAASYVVPAFAGLGAPHWDPYARGAIVGLTRGTTAAHIARADARRRSRSRWPTCSRPWRRDAGARSARAARRRRRRGERPADAVPGRPLGRAGRAPDGHSRPPRSARPTSPASPSGVWTRPARPREDSGRVERAFEPADAAPASAGGCARSGAARSSGPGAGQSAR